MNQERRQKLFDTYPQLFVRRLEEQDDTRRAPIRWGLEHGDGWLTLVEDACMLIQNYTNDMKQINSDHPQPEILQVKEKFGKLRIYTTHCNDFIRGVVALAELTSGNTCEECGNPGTMRRRGWMRVRCESCEEMRKQKMCDSTTDIVSV